MADGYDADFYAWTQAQAQALRSRGSGGNALDYDNLAEEIESLGRSEKRVCTSLIEQILIPLLKIEFWGDARSLRGWRKEVRAFRRELERELTPTLRARLPSEVDELYAYARANLADDLEDQAIGVTLPRPCPYSWDDVLGRGEEWTPEPPAAG